MADGDTFADEVTRRVGRLKEGYESFAATIDLVGVGELLDGDLRGAIDRIDGLRFAIPEATLLFPGDSADRAVFAGDSWFVVREVSPDDDAESMWPEFVGRWYALACAAHEIERNLGDPGTRAIMSRGALAQVVDHEGWRTAGFADQTKNWFVLTGGSQALRKYTRAEAAGTSGGFTVGNCWHQAPGTEDTYIGTPMATVRPKMYGSADLYRCIYSDMCAREHARASLSRQNNGTTG